MTSRHVTSNGVITSRHLTLYDDVTPNQIVYESGVQCNFQYKKKTTRATHRSQTRVAERATGGGYVNVRRAGVRERGR